MFTNIWSHITSQNAPWTLSCLPSFSFYTHMLLSGLLISDTVVQSFVLMVQPGIILCPLKPLRAPTVSHPKLMGLTVTLLTSELDSSSSYALRKSHFQCSENYHPKKKKKNRICVFGCFASSVRCDRFQGSEYSINMVNIPLEH